MAWVTLVLPTEPVTAPRRACGARSRAASPSRSSAFRVSETMTATPATGLLARTPAAPRSRAAAANSWPSRSPASATKRSPDCSVRVSIETPVAANGAPFSAPPVAAMISDDVQSGSAMRRLQAEGGGGLVDVVERMDDRADRHALLVAFAGHHQHVAALQHRGGGADRLAAIADFAQARGAGADLGADRS